MNYTQSHGSRQLPALSPLQQQAIAIYSLLDAYADRTAISENFLARILTDTTKGKTTAQEIATAIQDMKRNGYLVHNAGEAPGTYRCRAISTGEITRCRREAVAVYGAIPQSCLPAASTGRGDGGTLISQWTRERFLDRYADYLLEIGVFTSAADVLDEMAGHVVSDSLESYDYLDRGYWNYAGKFRKAIRRGAAASESLREVLLPPALSEAFFSGGAVEPMLERAVEVAPRHAALRGMAVPCIAALCVWTGRQDLLERYAKLFGKEGNPAIAFARLFFGKAPTKLISKPIDYLGLRGKAVQTTLVGLLAAKFPPVPARLLQTFRFYLDRPKKPDLAAFLSGALEPSLRADAFWRFSNPRPDRKASESASTPRTAIVWLGRTLEHALSTDPAKRLSFPGAPQALRAAEAAEAAGLHFLAAQLGGLLAQWPETAEGGLALAAKVPQGMTLLWNRMEIAHPWDPLLEALEKVVAPLAKAKKPREAKKVEGAVLYGLLTLSTSSRRQAPEGHVAKLFTVDSFDLAVVKRRRDGTLPVPEKASTIRAIRKALLDRSVELSDNAVGELESILRAEIAQAGSDAHAARIQGTKSSALDLFLANRGTMALRFDLPASVEEHHLRGGGGVDEPTVEVSNISLKTEWTPNGELRLSIPPIAWQADVHILLERTEPDRFVWHRLPTATSSFLPFMREHGGNGVVVIPKGGAEKARGMLLDAAAAGLPVEGAITPAGDAAALKVVEGAARVVARLELREGVLSVQLRARPVAKEPDLLYEPGRGRAEIAVPSLKEPFLLRRDIVGEKAVADGVRAALADFSSEAEGDCAWSAETPARQLALLEALRGAVAADPGRVGLEWRGGAANRLDVGVVKSAAITGGKGKDWWLGVEGEFRLDSGKAVALADLIANLPRRIGGYVPLDGRTWLRLTAGLRRKLEALASAGTVVDGALRVSPAALPMLEEAFAESPEGTEGAGGDARDALRLPEELARMADGFREAMVAEHPVPEGLAARLRPYQTEGFEWLARLAACGLGACLADDMGLGKTVQLIALLLERAADGASLVVAPASVCGNWCAELARFAPGLRVVRAGDAATLPETLGPGDVVITSYGLLLSRETQFSALAWNVAVLDEAQAVKNADAKRAQAAKRLRARCRFVATGTPVENRLSDLWSLFDFLNPGLLGSLDSFRRRLLDPDGRPLPALKSLVRPLILRRLKGEVLRDLPPKTEITLDVELGEAERAAYETLREKELAGLSEAEDAGGGRQRIQILAALTRMRRFCCAPGLVLPGFGTGAKMEALESLLEDLRANGHRALVFSQFVDVLSLVRPILERRGWGYEYLDGSTPQAERTSRVEAFQRGAAPFFLISLKAGGTGLNLTAANYVVLLDPWWNPAVEDQAADRAHRIGQTNPVTVYRLVTRGTIEEKVVALHGDKRELSSAVLEGTGDAAVSAADLLALFRRE